MSRVKATGALRQREPRVRDKAYLAWVAKLPCVACLVRGFRTWPVHVAHVRSSYQEPGWREVGKAEKPSDVRTAPLCRNCHLDGADAQHRSNERSWWDRLGIYPPALCAALRAAYEAREPGDKVLQKFAADARKTCAERGRAP